MFKELFKILHKYRPAILLAIPVFIYVLVALYYMYPVITHCSVTVMAFGDSVSGPIWLNSVSPNAPWWGFTQMTNYPFGEQLGRPIHLSAGLQYLWYWLLTLPLGSVCAFNIVNFIGFVFSAYCMFLFIRWLTNNYYIAIIAGFAVSFSPYFQAKVGVHPGYGYQGILILLIWASLLLITTLKIRFAFLVGVLLAICAYWDPYFVMLAMFLIVPTSIIGLVWKYLKFKPKDGHRLLVNWIIAAGTFILLIMPLAYVRVTSAADINNLLSESRNPILFDAQIYSNRPIEYIMPAENNPFFVKIFGSVINIDRHGSNSGEYTVGLSMTLLVLAVVGSVVIAWEYFYRNRWPIKQNLKISPILLLVLLWSILLIALIFSLPPQIGNIKSPSYLLVSNIDMWRVLSRLYVVINIALIIISSIVLFVLFNVIKNNKLKFATLLFVSLILAVEYQAYGLPRPTWSYKNDVPGLYYRLKDNGSINVIAEYPLAEPAKDFDVSEYLAFQKVHGKKLLNSSAADSTQADLRNSLRDLNDTHTPKVLLQLGVDAVIVRTFDGKPPNLQEDFSLLDSDSGACLGKCTVWLYKINSNTTKVNPTIIKFGDYIRRDYAKSYDIAFPVKKNADIFSKMPDTPQICFSLISNYSNPKDVKLKYATGETRISIGSQSQNIIIPSNKVEVLTNADEDIRVSDIGCK